MDESRNLGNSQLFRDSIPDLLSPFEARFIQKFLPIIAECARCLRTSPLHMVIVIAKGKREIIVQLSRDKVGDRRSIYTPLIQKQADCNIAHVIGRKANN